MDWLFGLIAWGFAPLVLVEWKPAPNLQTTNPNHQLPAHPQGSNRAETWAAQVQPLAPLLPCPLVSSRSRKMAFPGYRETLGRREGKGVESDDALPGWQTARLRTDPIRSWTCGRIQSQAVWGCVSCQKMIPPLRLFAQSFGSTFWSSRAFYTARESKPASHGQVNCRDPARWIYRLDVQTVALAI